MQHKKSIDKYSGSLHELTEDIGNLDYDTLVELFTILSQKFEKDAAHDLELNHPKVSKNLQNIASKLKDIAEDDAQKLADLCRKYNEKGIIK